MGISATGRSGVHWAHGIHFRKRKKLGKNTALNVSKSGASISRKAGPVTLSSRGNLSVRLGKGFGFRKKLF